MAISQYPDLGTLRPTKSPAGCRCNFWQVLSRLRFRRLYTPMTLPPQFSSQRLSPDTVAPFWATMRRSRPTARGSFHSRTAQSFPLCTIVTSRRRKTTRSLAKPSLSSLVPYEHSVYGQRLHEVRCDGWLGVRYLHRWQTRRAGVNDILLPLPQSGQG
jgi:hypothetical protein